MGRRNNRRTGPVAEDEVGTVVGGVDQARLHVDADGQHVSGGAAEIMPRATETAYSQPEQAAFRSNAGNRGQVQAVLHDGRRRGHCHVGRGGGQHDGVDVLVVDARLADRLQRRLVGHAGGLFVVGSPTPLANARHLVDVLFRDLGKRGDQFGVGDQRSRQIAAHAANHHGLPTETPAARPRAVSVRAPRVSSPRRAESNRASRRRRLQFP